MYTVIRKKLNVFIKKNQNIDTQPCFVSEDKDSYEYEFFCPVNIKTIIDNNIDKIKIYIEKPSSIRSSIKINSMDHGRIGMPSKSAMSILRMNDSAVVNHILKNSSALSSKILIKTIDPKNSIILESSQKNRKNSNQERFGTKKVFRTLVQNLGDKNVINDDGGMASLLDLKSLSNFKKRKILSKDLIKVFDYNQMKGNKNLENVNRINSNNKKIFKSEDVEKVSIKNIYSQLEASERNLIPVKRKNNQKVIKINCKLLKKHIKKYRLDDQLICLYYEAYDSENDLVDKHKMFFNHSYLQKFTNLNVPDINFSARKTKDSAGFGVTTKLQKHDKNLKLTVYNKFNSNTKKISEFKFNRVASLNLDKTSMKARLNLKSKKIFNDQNVKQFNLSNKNFLRFTPTINNISFDNCSSATFGNISKNENSYIPIIAKVKRDHMLIECDISNLNPEIVKIRPVKRNITNTNKTKKYSYLKNENYLPIESVFLNQEENETIRFLDYDVKEGRVYDYCLEVTYDNTEKKKSFSHFIEKYEKKDDLITLSVENSESGFKVFFVKNETNADQVFKDLLGDLYNLFEEELKEIKSLNASSVVCMVEKIDRSTGEVQLLGYYQFGNQQNQSPFFEVKYSRKVSSEKCTFKITPLVAPVAEIISQINDTVSTRNNDTRFSKVDFYSFPKIQKKISNLENNVLSKISNKFTTKNARLRGQIQGRGINNLYSDYSTGDIEYYDTTNFKDSEPLFAINNAKVSFIKKRSKTNTNEYNLILDINANFSSNVDHVVITTNENGKFCFGCYGHIDHKKSNYKFLLSRSNVYGKIDFYITIVDIHGNNNGPNLITSAIKKLKLQG